MKLIFNHNEGSYVEETGACLMEVDCLKENETSKFMFENGWIPYIEENIWYQCKSARLKLSPISKRRKKELSKINFYEKGDFEEITERARPFGCFDQKWLDYFKIKEPNYKFFMDDAAFGIVNFFDDQIIYTNLVWDKNKVLNSYGTLSYYHLIEKFRNDYEYMYITEYYEIFSYKENLQGFEFWDGKKWNINIKELDK